MSAVDGWFLLRYQAAQARCPSMSTGWWSAVAYHIMVRVWQARWKGTCGGLPRLPVGLDYWRARPVSL